MPTITIFLAITTIVFFALFMYFLLNPRSNTNISWLFVQSSPTATVSAVGSGYTLTMENVSPETHRFSDRPVREATIISTESFVNRFSQMFGSDLPNCAIASEFGVDIIKVTSPPQLNGSTLTYTFELIDKLSSTHHVVGTFNNVKLFIDSVQSNTTPKSCVDVCSNTYECKAKLPDWHNWQNCIDKCTATKPDNCTP